MKASEEFLNRCRQLPTTIIAVLPASFCHFHPTLVCLTSHFKSPISRPGRGALPEMTVSVSKIIIYFSVTSRPGLATCWLPSDKAQPSSVKWRHTKWNSPMAGLHPESCFQSGKRQLILTYHQTHFRSTEQMETWCEKLAANWKFLWILAHFPQGLFGWLGNRVTWADGKQFLCVVCGLFHPAFDRSIWWW